jgi:hypothetical protein
VLLFQLLANGGQGLWSFFDPGTSRQQAFRLVVHDNHLSPAEHKCCRRLITMCEDSVLALYVHWRGTGGKVAVDIDPNAPLPPLPVDDDFHHSERDDSVSVMDTAHHRRATASVSGLQSQQSLAQSLPPPTSPTRTPRGLMRASAPTVCDLNLMSLAANLPSAATSVTVTPIKSSRTPRHSRGHGVTLPMSTWQP